MKPLHLLMLFAIIITISCNKTPNNPEISIIFLHHSTGKIIWDGKEPSLFQKITNKLLPEKILCNNALIPELMSAYNKKNNKTYSINEITFPKSKPYGWNNFPFDYYNIWVKNEGNTPFMEEPTLEILTKEHQVILLKHCFPVCYIHPDSNNVNINSDEKTITNYQLQYNALKEKFHQFPNTKFIIFTGAAQVKNNISEESAARAKQFFNWVINEWDDANDNIYIWDLFELQTDGGLYFKNKFAASPNNSHPNTKFAKIAAIKLFNRIIDVIETNGKKTTLTGEKL
ncbi:MAG: hypothetical protein JW717_03630 [Marinilabiliaceae bacterium]|nr:hypothetical protein [Marinilabiliaceae bacterium]